MDIEKERKRLHKIERYSGELPSEFIDMQRKLVAALEQLEQAREALRHIKRHQETVSPTGARLSTTWNIANGALNQQGEG